VRDDVQRYIALTYSDSARARASLTQYAKTVQKLIIDANDAEMVVRDAKEQFAASDCLVSLYEIKEVSRRKRALNYDVILNTQSRLDAYGKANEKLGGAIIGITDDKDLTKGCAFDPQTLPD
jgi:hypothetical protein